jgi:hypothetical protein
MANVRRTSTLTRLLLALPLVLVAACDSGSSSGGPLKGGGTGTPGTGTPGTGGTAASALTGAWGARAMSSPNQGEVWQFFANGEFQLNSYVLQNNMLYREITINGTFTAANGTLTVTGVASTCTDAMRGPFNFSYTVNGTSFVLSNQGKSYTYTKDDAPNPDAQKTVLGCFDTMGNFTESQVMNIGL